MSRPVLTLTHELLLHTPRYIPQDLTVVELAAGTNVDNHLARVWERWRRLTGKADGLPPTEREQSAAIMDYSANLAKHPFRHQMRTEASDPRAATATPEQLLDMAVENQVWDGTSWVVAPNKALAADVTPLECSYQHLIGGLLHNRLGRQWRLVDSAGHTAFEAYLPSLRKWMWVESTFNSHYRWAGSDPLNYVPLSGAELHEVSLRGGETTEIVAVMHPYQPQRTPKGGAYYLPAYHEYSPQPWKGMAFGLDGRSIRREAFARYTRVLPTGTGAQMFAAQIAGGWVVDRDPRGLQAGAGIIYASDFASRDDGTLQIALATNLRGAVQYQRSLNGGAWANCLATDTLRLQPGDVVQWRAVSGTANSGVVEARRSA